MNQRNIVSVHSILKTCHNIEKIHFLCLQETGLGSFDRKIIIEGSATPASAINAPSLPFVLSPT